MRFTKEATMNYLTLLAVAPIVLFPVFFFFLLLLLMFPRRNCPDCGTPLPRFVSPLTKTRRQWLEGGWVCPNCGIDVDWKGLKIEIPYVVGWARALKWLPVLAVLGGTAIILLVCAILLLRNLASPAKPSEPPAKSTITRLPSP